MNIQMIDEFRRRTNASYDEAKYYLERHNGDLLEAIIAFEKERTGYQANERDYRRDERDYRRQERDYRRQERDYRREERSNQRYEYRSERSCNAGRGFMRVIQKLIDTKIVVTDKSMRTFPIPVILPLIMVPAWHIIILIAVGMMIMGFKFHIQQMPDPNVNVEAFFNKMKDKVKDTNRTSY